MTRFHRLLLPLAAVFLLAWAGLVVAQNSPGGAFAPSGNYTVSGAWTWRAQTTPFLFRGTQSVYGTSFIVTNPTANRTWTLPDLNGGNFVGTTATQTLTNKTFTTPTLTTPALSTPVITGAITGVYNLAGTPTVPTAGIGFTNATSGTITVATPTGALATPTVTLPAMTGSVGTGYACGASLAANAACGNTAQAGTLHFLTGSALLAGSTSTITGIVPAFTSATSWWCVANDVTTRANPVQMIPASASTVTITNTTGATDLIQFVCMGN